MLDPVTATIIAVGAVGASAVTSNKARKEQKRANQAQERVRQAQSARQNLAAVREQKVAQSQIIQAGATQGTSDSSKIGGAYGSLGSVTAGNIGFANSIDSLQQEIYSRMQAANRYQAQAGYYGQAANLALQGASMFGSPTQSTAPTTTAGSMSNAGAQASSVAGRGPFSNPLPPSPFG